MLIGEQISNITRGMYHNKNARKFKNCTVLIARGIKGSTSHTYAKHCSPVNPGVYKSTDVVAVSVNGVHANDIPVNEFELAKAIKAKAMIVTDNLIDRLRPFNTAERGVAAILDASGYREMNASGTWVPKGKGEN